MAHEELQRQYDEDCEKYDYPWEFWEVCDPTDGWVTMMCMPLWSPKLKYRRKEPPFIQKHFTGMNRKDAERLLGKKVEFSHYGQHWSTGQLVATANEDEPFGVDFYGETQWVHYIRTTPETHAHPTIAIPGVELPRPETSAPKHGTKYWFFDPTYPGLIDCYDWSGDKSDRKRLKAGCVHLTEARAQAWADWWENVVMVAVRGGE